ncbi:hypothetical protein K466DRAFT_604445 [Polyporus arcularius HHB13444]|uniref:Uncharacterized protein n=1 Tax=Polyporus arcularius HHB13444 TaxID=1314778 RepID=A0A5C3NVY8_9APHY|nr:hypothetical protein K466DRAFT_604445 [Polyporus arcularius HHB13444]
MMICTTPFPLASSATILAERLFTGIDEEPEASRWLKELRPVFGHKLIEAWPKLAPKIVECLDSKNVLFTTIDGIRFAIGDGPAGAVTIWIGVRCGELTAERAHDAARSCLALLKEFDITDVDIEFRESLYTRLAGPTLLKAVPDGDATAAIRARFTSALGLSIAPAGERSTVEGTAGFYFAEGGDSDVIYFVAARHVLFPPPKGKLVFPSAVCPENALFLNIDGEAPRRDVLLLSTNKLEEFIVAIQEQIKDLMSEIKQYLLMVDNQRMKGMEANADIIQCLNNSKAAVQALNEFQEVIKKQWMLESNRIIGQVVWSPPITPGVTDCGYTDDFAVVRLDRSKVGNAFMGNVLSLGSGPTAISSADFSAMMYLGPQGNHMKPVFANSDLHLLKLQGPIPEEEMTHPVSLEECLDQDKLKTALRVIKNGSTTGPTIGCATGIFSITRQYFDDGSTQTSKEWAICPGRDKSRVLSSPVFCSAGDSGALVADGCGRMGGLLSGSSGSQLSNATDIAYATPAFYLWSRIQEQLPNAHLNPVIST